MQINTQDWTKCKFITVFKIDNVNIYNSKCAVTDECILVFINNKCSQICKYQKLLCAINVL